MVTGYLTGYNTQRRQLHVMGVIENPLCRICGLEEETSTRILCCCDTFTILRYHHLGSDQLDPEDVGQTWGRGAVWIFIKGTGPHKGYLPESKGRNESDLKPK